MSKAQFSIVRDALPVKVPVVGIRSARSIRNWIASSSEGSRRGCLIAQTASDDIFGFMTPGEWVRKLSETELYEVVQELLFAMGFHSITITHGPIEGGKDLVFAETDRLGRCIWRAIQAKAETLTGSLTSRKGLRAALFQCEAALDTAYIDHNGDSHEMAEVWLVTTFPISQHAILTAVGKLKNLRRVYIIDGPHFGELITNHLPTLLESHSTPLKGYLKTLLEFCDSPEEYLSTRMRARYSFTQVYVPSIAGVSIPALRSDRPLCSVASMPGISAMMPELQIIAALARRRLLPGRYVPRILKLCDVLSTLATGAGCLPTLKQAASTVVGAVDYFRTFIGVPTSDIEPETIALSLSRNIDTALLSSVLFTQEEVRQTAEMHQTPSRGIRSEDYKDVAAVYRSTGDVATGWSSIAGAIERHARATINEKETNAAQECLDRLRDSMRQFDEALSTLFQCSRAAISPFLNSDNCLAEQAPHEAFAALHDLSLIREILCAPGQSVEECLVFVDGLTLGQRLSRVMFVGPLGIGKTTLLKQLCAAYVSKRADQDRRSIPVLTPLGTIRGQAARRTTDLLLGNAKAGFAGAENYPIQEIDWFLDGLDEVEAVSVRTQILAWCADSANSSRTIVLSSRAGAVVTYVANLARAVIQPFSPLQRTEYILKFPWQDPKRAERTIQVLQSNSELAALSETPLLLTLIVLLAQHQDPEKLPGRRDEIYERIAKLLMGEWDASKGVTRPYALDALELRLAVVEKVAYILYALRRAAFTRDDFCHLCLGSVPPGAITPTIVDALFDDMIRDCLLVPASPFEYKFFHFSIHEYLAAKDLSRDITPERVESAVIEYFRLGGAWWEEVLTFYAGIKRDLKGLIANRLMNLLPNVSADDPVLLMRLLGRWLAAADLTDLERVAVKGFTVQTALHKMGRRFQQ